MVPLPSAFGNAFAGAGPVSAFAAGGAFGQGEILYVNPKTGDRKWASQLFAQ